MKLKEKIYRAASEIQESRNGWYQTISAEPNFRSMGGIIYPYDTTAANLDPMFELFEKSDFIRELEGGEIRTICDIGCANGEIAFSFADAGFDVSAIDFSFKHDRAPYVVSRVAELGGWNVAVVDMSVDRYFSFTDLTESRIAQSGNLPDAQMFDFSICLGLLYHLKNPFAFLESLSKLTNFALVGTHVITHTPNLKHRVEEIPLAYIVDAEELNSDPTNFWMFTSCGFERLARRCGFQVLDSISLPNNPLQIAVPDRVDLGVRKFLMLKSQYFK